MRRSHSAQGRCPAISVWSWFFSSLGFDTLLNEKPDVPDLVLIRVVLGLAVITDMSQRLALLTPPTQYVGHYYLLIYAWFFHLFTRCLYF